jgi:hypothetical protein
MQQQVSDLFVARLGQVLNHIPAIDQAAVFPVDLADSGVGNGDPAQPCVQNDFAVVFHADPLNLLLGSHPQ